MHEEIFPDEFSDTEESIDKIEDDDCPETEGQDMTEEQMKEQEQLIAQNTVDMAKVKDTPKKKVSKGTKVFKDGFISEDAWIICKEEEVSSDIDTHPVLKDALEGIKEASTPIIASEHFFCEYKPSVVCILYPKPLSERNCKSCKIPD